MRRAYPDTGAGPLSTKEGGAMISKNKLGVVVGSAFGLWHLTWALLVATGVAQWLMDWTFRLHFIQPVYLVTAFRPQLAIALIAVTSVLGFIFGWIAAGIWNWLHTERGPATSGVMRHA
jgi:hypothetical protein